MQVWSSVGKTPWRRKCQPTPVSLTEKFHGQSNLVGYIPWGHKEQTQLEHTHTHHSLVSHPHQILSNLLKVKVQSLSRVQLFETPWIVDYQVPPSLGFSRQEYWSGLPFPSPQDLPNPGIEPGSLTLQADTLPSEPPGKSLDLKYWFPKLFNQVNFAPYQSILYTSARDDVCLVQYCFLLHLENMPFN